MSVFKYYVAKNKMNQYALVIGVGRPPEHVPGIEEDIGIFTTYQEAKNKADEMNLKTDWEVVTEQFIVENNGQSET